MFDPSPLFLLPEKAPVSGPFVAPVITRRPARGGQAALFARSLWGEEKLYIGDKDSILPYPLGKKAKAKPPIVIPKVGELSFVQDDIKAYFFRDSSLLLCLRDEKGWYVLPEIFAVQSTNLVTYGHEIKVRMETPTLAKLEGARDLIEPLKDAFWDNARFWAEHTKQLPPVSPDFTGFLPSFAPIPRQDPELLAAGESAVKTLAATLLMAMDGKNIRLELSRITPEVDDLGRGIQVSISGRNADNAYISHGSQIGAWRKWVTEALAHPNFPLQGRDWYQASPTDSNDMRRHAPAYTIEVSHDTLSAHEKINAYKNLAIHFPGLAFPE